MAQKLELDKFENWLSWKNKLCRACWGIVNTFFVRPFFLPQMWHWRRFWLQLFGAKLHRKSYVFSDVAIWAPWNLEMGPYSCLASGVKVYNTGRIIIGGQVTVSQGAYLCPGSHDITDPKFPMVCSDMVIEDQAWIATEAFVGGRNIRIGEGAVVAARAVVLESVDPWMVMVGNPARVVKKRVIRECGNA